MNLFSTLASTCLLCVFVNTRIFQPQILSSNEIQCSTGVIFKQWHRSHGRPPLYAHLSCLASVFRIDTTSVKSQIAAGQDGAKLGVTMLGFSKNLLCSRILTSSGISSRNQSATLPGPGFSSEATFRTFLNRLQMISLIWYYHAEQNHRTVHSLVIILCKLVWVPLVKWSVWEPCIFLPPSLWCGKSDRTTCRRMDWWWWWRRRRRRRRSQSGLPGGRFWALVS